MDNKNRFIRMMIASGKGRLLYGGEVDDPKQDYSFKPVSGGKVSFHLFYIINDEGCLVPMIGRHTMKEEDETLLFDDKGTDPQHII